MAELKVVSYQRSLGRVVDNPDKRIFAVLEREAEDKSGKEHRGVELARIVSKQ